MNKAVKMFKSLTRQFPGPGGTLRIKFEQDPKEMLPAPFRPGMVKMRIAGPKPDTLAGAGVFLYNINMGGKAFTVLDLVDLDLKEHNSLNLRCIGGRRGLSGEIGSSDLNRPMGAIMGFYDVFAHQRIQIFGVGESACLQKLAREDNTENIKRMFSYPIPCCIFTTGLEPTAIFFEEAEKAGCPILQTDLPSSEFTARILRVLAEVFAPRQSLHGVLVEVYGLGILILGDSGVGKSETALDLIKRGHRLIADDVVDIHCANGNTLMGAGINKIIGHHMEIRGLGVLNMTHLFGVGAIKERTQIELVVMLEEWDAAKPYDRLGAEDKTMNILGMGVTKLEIPVKPGRNVPILIETAAMNERLKKMGYNTAKEFNQNILKWIESDNLRSVYFGSEDII